MNWTGGPNAWACWGGPDILVGQVFRGREVYYPKDRYGEGLGIFLTLHEAKAAVERAAWR